MRHRFTERWRTSLQTRVLGSILVASAVVMLVLAFVLVSFVTQRLVNTKLELANNEIDRARAAVELQIDATGTASSTQVRLQSARAALVNQGTTAGDQAVYEPVLIVNNPDGSVLASPEGYRIPERLRSFVSQGQVSYQYATIERADASPYKALIIGTPTETDIPNLQVYLVLSLEQDEATLALLRGLFSGAAIVLVVLLVGIAWLLTQQVITPVRSASRIAERFSSGHLRERMVVDGEDEMARLAVSFNAMAESLSKQINQLEEYGNLQKQFTSDVSHELRSPLTTVRMAADMIVDDAEHLPASTRRASELMVHELDRFESLLNDLLEISRHDAGVADLATSSIDLRQCVQAAVQQTEHIAAKLNVPVHVDMPDEPVRINGDSRRIERILRNLLANALDHSEGNPVELTLKENEYAVGVAVVDHGVGLEYGQEDLVFNRFWRADPSRKRHSGGTGLGLAISLEDTRLHGGTLDAAGMKSVGTMFRLILPREPGQEIIEPPIVLEAPKERYVDVTPAIADAPNATAAEHNEIEVDEDAVDEAELAAAYDPDLDGPDLDGPAHLGEPASESEEGNHA
ncbi:MtrAB system histidine kinase MtrB [Corynebacterium kozikiae]|uniref:MtrAB system histidine kinase MtrB n=1 Tax=Corynebacterium kozikiae TaxID=2968469 RepID=UPI00211C6662|nr:MtrAB system histidine kinase MtrB [Corynebacterium sp. 76QC2CO]MCQ9343106.1 MtrAB system histidine kinase MtrB [Corynebacterium sp. 76QC2CO]